MGRSPTRNKNLPSGMRARHRGDKVYYYLDTGAKPRKEIPLGTDYVAAVRAWAERTKSNASVSQLVTFRHVAEKYQREVIPKKSPATQTDNLRELAYLYKFFDDPPVALDSIEPVHVRQYLDWRVTETVNKRKEENEKRVREKKPPYPITGKEGQVRANREKALFSHIWNFAREKGLTSAANPCAGVRSYREEGRDVYVDDAVYRAVHDCAEQPLQDALDLAYLIGQRPADVLKLSRSDIKEGALYVEQNKTGKKLRISIEGELADLVERIKRRRVTGLQLICNLDGTPMTRHELRGAFDRARVAAAIIKPALAADIREFQFRDLRAKAGTDKEEREGMAAAQAQLGHSTPAMTAHYVRHRKGKLVTPTK